MKAPRFTPLSRTALRTGFAALLMAGVGAGFIAQAEARGHKGGHHGGAQEMLRLFDTNNDGALTQAEIDAGIEARFAQADANGDGEVSVEEFGVVWDEMTERRRERRQVRAFQRLDPNGDGAVTQAELTERFGAIVERMDRNGDGELSREDRGRHGGKRGERSAD